MAYAADLAIELQKIYDSEINMEISWFWDGGIDIRGKRWQNATLMVGDVLPFHHRSVQGKVPARTSVYVPLATRAVPRDQNARRLAAEPACSWAALYAGIRTS